MKVEKTIQLEKYKELLEDGNAFKHLFVVQLLKAYGITNWSEKEQLQKTFRNTIQ